MAEINSSGYNYKRLRKRWNKVEAKFKVDRSYIKRRGHEFIWVLIDTFKWYIWIIFWVSMLFIVIEFLKTYVMYLSMRNFKKMKDYSNVEDLYWDVGTLIGGLAFTQLLFAVLSSSIGFYVNLIAQRFTAAIRVLIFEKLLKKSFEREQLLSMGEMTNIIGTDTSNLEEITEIASGLFTLPIEISLGLIGLYVLMGYAVFAALAVLGVTLGVNWLISRVYSKQKQKYNEKKDERTNLIVELFENIKFVKLNALESKFLGRIIKKKEEEIKYVIKLISRFILSSTLNDLGPAIFLISLNSFSIYFTGSINLEKAFTSVVILNIFKRNFKDIPDMMVSAVDILVSSQRLSYYLFSEEVDNQFITYMDPLEMMFRGPPEEKENALILKNGNFYWKDEEVKRFYAEEKAKAFKKGKSKAEKKLKKLKKGNLGVLTVQLPRRRKRKEADSATQPRKKSSSRKPW